MLYEELKISTCSMCHKLRTQTLNLNRYFGKMYFKKEFNYF